MNGNTIVNGKNDTVSGLSCDVADVQNVMTWPTASFLPRTAQSPLTSLFINNMLFTIFLTDSLQATISINVQLVWKVSWYADTYWCIKDAKLMNMRRGRRMI